LSCNAAACRLPPSASTLLQTTPGPIGFLGKSRPLGSATTSSGSHGSLPTIVENQRCNKSSFRTLFSTLPLSSHPVESFRLAAFLPRVTENVVALLSQNAAAGHSRTTALRAIPTSDITPKRLQLGALEPISVVGVRSQTVGLATG
jgi:hypothetical protein